MNIDYYKEYLRITNGCQQPVCPHASPEEQGMSIKKLTILEAADICYSTETIINFNREQGN